VSAAPNRRYRARIQMIGVRVCDQMIVGEMRRNVRSVPDERQCRDKQVRIFPRRMTRAASVDTELAM
jgi:hypothetical protein